jgi:hypothetical protein
MIVFKEKQFFWQAALPILAQGAQMAVGAVQTHQANEIQQQAVEEQNRQMRRQTQLLAQQTGAIKEAARKNPAAAAGMAQASAASIGVPPATPPPTQGMFSAVTDFAKDTGKLLLKNKHKFIIPAFMGGMATAVAYGADKAVQGVASLNGEKFVNPEDVPHYDANGNLVQPKKRMSTKKKLLLAAGAAGAGLAGATALHKAGVVNLRPAWDAAKMYGRLGKQYLKGMGPLGWAMSATPLFTYGMGAVARRRAEKQLREKMQQRAQLLGSNDEEEVTYSDYQEDPERPKKKKKWSLGKKIAVGAAATVGALGAAAALSPKFRGTLANTGVSAGQGIKGLVGGIKNSAHNIKESIKSGYITDAYGRGFGGRSTMEGLSEEMNSPEMSDTTKKVGNWVGKHTKLLGWASVPAGIWIANKLAGAGANATYKALNHLDNNAFAYQKSQNTPVPMRTEDDEDEEEN